MKRINSPIPTYIVVLGSVTMMLLLIRSLQPLLAPHVFLLFCTPVAISSWYGGMKYGMIAAVLSVIMAKLYFIEPKFTFVYNLNAIVRSVIFILNSTLISWLISELKNTKYHLQSIIQKQQQSESELKTLVTANQENALRDRLIVEESLRQREEELRLIMNIVPAHISYVDANQCYRFHNIKYEEWFKSSEIDGKHLREVLGESVYENILPYVELALSGEKAIYEAQVPHEDGSIHTTSVYYVPHINQQRKVAGFVALIQDITERKREEKERERLLECEKAARSQAEAVNRMKDEFLATLSHELRTPLTAISGWISLIRGGQLNEVMTNQALETIERNSQSLTKLIAEILDVSRIIQGKLCLDIQPVSLSRVIELAVSSMSPAANAKEISIECNLDPSVGIVMGDFNRLQQILWNLLSNAIKFTPDRGRVCIQVERINYYVQIRVSDTGVGIPAEFLPHVFEHFRQADSSTTRTHNGLGLGLAIVRHLVELHGGTVAVESPGINQGTVLIVNLPMKAVVANSMNHPSEKSVLHKKLVKPMEILMGLQLLIVDDEPDARNLLATVLADYGAQTITASSVEEAMMLLAKFQPNVLISDIAMPGEDGYALIRRVRTLAPEQGGRIPALALTAYARSEDQHQVLLSGFQSYFAKPVNPLDLVLVVADLATKADSKIIESRF